MEKFIACGYKRNEFLIIYSSLYGYLIGIGNSDNVQDKKEWC